MNLQLSCALLNHSQNSGINSSDLVIFYLWNYYGHLKPMIKEKTFTSKH